MPTQKQGTPRKNREQPDHQLLNAEIGKNVMDSLGRPGDLYNVQVRPLWEDRYRVNVFVGADGVSAKVAHSYFLVIGSDGSVVASTPKITRQY